MRSVAFCALLLFSSLSLFFPFPTTGAAAAGRPATVWRKKLGELVPIPDVKHNKEVQHLGRLALQAANEDYVRRCWQNWSWHVPPSELLQFIRVTSGKRAVDDEGEMYYLHILSTKRNNQILGSCDVRLRKLSPNSIVLISWSFRVMA